RAMEFTSVSAINTTVEVSPGLVAVGRSTDVTIAVKDPTGRPITGLMSGAFEAKLMVEGVPSATTAVTDFAEVENGIYTFSIANSVAESGILEVVVTGVSIVSQPMVTYIVPIRYVKPGATGNGSSWAD